MSLDKGLRDLVWSRPNARCEYCQISQAADALPFQIDHVIAIQHHGSTREDNLALACFSCNHHKGQKIAGFDTVTPRTVPLFDPRRDVWTAHFRWNGAPLEGLTPAGRVTVRVLAMNLDYRVALRRALIMEGTFPP